MPFDVSKVSRLYVIGDIHGRPDLLDRMAAAIKRDLGPHPSDASLTVTLGDYVDRGPDSRGVIERLMRNPFSMPYVALRGNHEQLLISFLKNPSVGQGWRELGGLETLHSYGIAVASLRMGNNFENAAQAFRKAIPDSHVKFLSSLNNSLTVGNYFLCHAGVKPGVPLDRQQPEDLLWIRESFLTSKKNFGKIVVHGHTPCEQVEELPNRINIDTGAYATGRLTCLVAEPKGQRFLATG
jgi:serine/threonine protein phosphatase 1